MNDPVNNIDVDGLSAAGAVIGGLAGFIGGGIYALANDKDPVAGALLGAGGGVLLGGLIGNINFKGVGQSVGGALKSAAPSIAVQGARIAADVITQTNPYAAQWAVYSQPQLPSFSTLSSNYPLPYEHRPDRTPINPKLPLDDATGANFAYFNQCAIRMSITLRKSGVNLSGVKNITNPGGQTYANGNVIGATNLAVFLLKYGKPQVYDGTKVNIASTLKNKKGIIYFQGYNENYGTTLPAERSNGNVHIDLWNNDTIMAPYLQQMLDAKRVLFWEVK